MYIIQLSHLGSYGCSLNKGSSSISEKLKNIRSLGLSGMKVFCFVLIASDKPIVMVAESEQNLEWISVPDISSERIAHVWGAVFKIYIQKWICVV